MPSALTIRHPRFGYPDDLPLAWNPQNPEFSYAANAVSLLMPYAEPRFAKAVRDVAGQLEPGLRARAEDFAQQEIEHNVQHRKLNRLLIERDPALRRIDRLIKRWYAYLGRKRSSRFNLAYAAASETIAFTLARWAEKHLSRFFSGADPAAASMFLWHLAEEVEHKTVAFDVWEAVDGSRLRYAFAMAATFTVDAAFLIPAILLMAGRDRRLLRPGAWVNLVRLWLSFTFELFPNMAVSALPGHHPSKFTDPVWLPDWLATFDPDESTMPAWDTGAPTC